MKLLGGAWFALKAATSLGVIVAAGMAVIYLPTMGAPVAPDQAQAFTRAEFITIVLDDALYRGRINDGEVFGQYRETEANRYAAELLMPAAAMRAKWRERMRSFAEFAAAFGVSAAAARIRLKELGYGA